MGSLNFSKYSGIQGSLLGGWCSGGSELNSLECEQGGRIIAFLGAKPWEQLLARVRRSVSLGIAVFTRFSEKIVIYVTGIIIL